MNTSEIRKGNLVYLDNPKSWKELQNVLMKIKGIGYNPTALDGINETITVEKNIIGKYDIYSDYNQYAQYIQPIKLTIQWLYELGFKSDTDETDEFILNGFRIYEIGNNLEFANHDFPIKLEFVHQLQNLFFALTGSELVCSA